MLISIGATDDKYNNNTTFSISHEFLLVEFKITKDDLNSYNNNDNAIIISPNTVRNNLILLLFRFSLFLRVFL